MKYNEIPESDRINGLVKFYIHDDESDEYYPPIAGGDLGRIAGGVFTLGITEGLGLFDDDPDVTSTQKTTIPAKETDEQRLDRLNLEFAEQQKLDLDLARIRANPRLALAGSPSVVGDFEISPELRQQLEDRVTQLDLFDELENLSGEQQLKRLRGESILTEGQQQNVRNIFGTAQTRGEESITRFLDELAGGRGLRTSDDPVARRGGESIERLLSQLGASESQAILGLESAEVGSSFALQGFINNLQQQSILNRINISSPNPIALSAASQLAFNRFQQPSIFGTQTFSPFQRFVQGVGAVGSLAQGIGGAAAAAG